ncbi:MAG TPA: methylmalonyl-CoA mutase family protein, partial [Acidimicrobiales bacterium]|nr:methylmalonyl-CoA mutase family protein [Acidimicrobiales bacterium]
MATNPPGFDNWEKAFKASQLRDAPFDTMSGVPLDAVYGPRGADGERLDPSADQIGWPGAYPYTRGPYASMYRTRLWT